MTLSIEHTFYKLNILIPEKVIKKNQINYLSL